MKITKIELKNYRAFYGKTYTIHLPKGENLVVFGENGSGKSSLFYALQDFFTVDKSELDITKKPLRNFFATQPDTFIKIEFSNDETYEFSDKKDTTNKLINSGVDTTKGFIDYKGLLQTYYAQQKSNTVNIFKFLVEEIFVDLKPIGATWTFGEKWKEIIANLPKNDKPSEITKLEKLIKDFNEGLAQSVKDLQKEAQKILDKFQMNLVVELNPQGVNYNKTRRAKEDKLENQMVKMIVDFHGNRIDENHHNLLNEARLSAIAASLFFASFKLQPTGTFRMMVLDDVLIGLDMSNRVPVLEILKNDFTDFQIFLTTYDRNWYEIAKDYLESWKPLEIYVGEKAKKDFPVLIEKDLSYEEKSKRYFEAKDYPASANYLRKELEKLLKQKLPATYQINEESDGQVKALQLDTLVQRFEKFYTDCNVELPEKLMNLIKTYKKLVLNPMSHDDIKSPIYKKEITATMKFVSELKKEPKIERKKILNMNSQFDYAYNNPPLTYRAVIELADHLYLVKYGTKQYFSKVKYRMVNWEFQGVAFSNMSLANNQSISNDVVSKITVQTRNMSEIISGIFGNRGLNIALPTEEDFSQQINHKTKTLAEIMQKN